jgi:hypothetical protein
MKHFFEYNIPADNQLNGHTDKYIPVIAEWEGAFYNDGRPLVRVEPVNMGFYEAIIVKNWLAAKRDIEKIAEDHFAGIAYDQRISQATKVLQNAFPIADIHVDETGNTIVEPVAPTLERFTKDIMPAGV